MTATEETEPLISAMSTCSANKIQKYNYHTISLSENEGNALHNESMESSYDLYPSSSELTNLNFIEGTETFYKIKFSWSNVNVHVNKKSNRIWDRLKFKGQTLVSQKHILKNAYGVAYPGELLVIMGASGAGKSTLLNALTFRLARGMSATGLLAVNGCRISANTVASMLGYVQQDDLFISTLTVKEHLMFQMLVKSNRRVPRKQRDERVKAVLGELALSKCCDTVIGVPGKVKGLSGGEMKRLSLASELLIDPPVMFCDEPTSGLDFFMAHQVISILKALTARGKTIVITLHQPSSELFALFDKILLMAEGRVAFTGTPAQAFYFFKILGVACPSNYNPADHFIQTLAMIPGRELRCKNKITTICDAFQHSQFGGNIALEAACVPHQDEDSFKIMDSAKHSHFGLSQYKASWCQQFCAVLWRSWLSVIKEPMLIKVRLLQTIMISLLIGFIYYDQPMNQDGVMNINGALFIFLTNMTFQNVFAVINVFCAELPIFLRENKSKMYRTSVYFICKTLAEIPIFLVIPLIFTAIVYPMIGLYLDFKHFFVTAGIMVLVTNVSTSFGYLISCISNNISMALSVGSPIIVPFLLFGGFFLNERSVPNYFVWLFYLSWFRYGNEALLINQWSEVESIACTKNNTICPKSGHMVLQTFDFKEENFWLDIYCLLGLIVAFRLLAFLALLLKTRRSN